jgi:hypothetical protein
MQVRYQLRHSPEGVTSLRQSTPFHEISPRGYGRGSSGPEGVPVGIAYVPFVAWFALLLFGLVDLDRTPEADLRHLARSGWLAALLLVPIVGALAWIAWGRPAHHPRAWPLALSTAGGPPSGFGPSPGGMSTRDPDGMPDSALQAILDRIDRDFDEAVRRSRERCREPGHGPGWQRPPDR